MASNGFRVNIDYFSHILFEFESHEYYIRHTSKLINEKINSAESDFKRHTDALQQNPEYDEQLFNFHEFDHQTITGIKDIFYDSIIIAIYSLLERKLYFLANTLSAGKVYKLDTSKKGGKIFKYRKYLEKVCEIGFKEIETEWKLIEGFNKLRNKIVHSEGRRELNTNDIDDKIIIDFLDGMEGVTIYSVSNSEYLYHFESDFILYNFLENIKIIFDHLYMEKVS